jgi:hypothetical protein
VAEKEAAATIVQSPYEDNVSGPSASRSHVDLPDTAGEIVKARLGADGVTLFDAALEGPVPCEFVAVTVKV